MSLDWVTAVASVVAAVACFDTARTQRRRSRGQRTGFSAWRQRWDHFRGHHD